MTQPRTIEFAVAVPNQIVADGVAIALRQNAYVAEVIYDEGEPDTTGLEGAAGLQFLFGEKSDFLFHEI